MADPHHLYSIIAKAICDAGKDDPEHQIQPEEAKRIGKCIVEALSEAGFQIHAKE